MLFKFGMATDLGETLDPNQLLTWREMGSVGLFVSKIMTGVVKPGYGIINLSYTHLNTSFMH